MGRQLAGEHVILCGEAPLPPRVKAADVIHLRLHGEGQNIDLEIIDISRKLATEVPDAVIDLLEIAAYVYSADQQITRGGEGVKNFGADWRRTFNFYIPVRMPTFWSAQPIVDTLRKTLSFLSDDTYDFHFSVLRHLSPLSSHQVAENLVQLFKEHAREVVKVMDSAIADHASDIRGGTLPASCAIVLAVAERYRTADSSKDGLAQKQAQGPIVNRTPRRKKVDNELESVRARVRQMKAEKMSASMMCKSLGSEPRPQGAAWAHLSWPEAWKSVHQNSVKVWLSKNSKPLK
jgi:hypothetical protein